MIGNDNFQELVSVLDRKGYKFPFEVRNPPGRKGVSDLREIIMEERRQGKTDLIDMYQDAFLDPKIQDIFQLRLPSSDDSMVLDLTDTLNIKGKGKVYGLQLSEIGPTHSLKDPVIVGLLLMRLMTRGIPQEGMDTLTDCGIVNSATAAKYYAELFELQGEYYIPSIMSHFDNALASDRFIVNHENEKFSGDGKEAKNACYKTLIQRLIVDNTFAKRALYLGHSELGWAAMYPVARRFGQILEKKGIEPTYLVSCVGAGTFFVPHSDVFNGMFGTKAILVEDEDFAPMTREHKLDTHIIEKIPAYLSPEAVDQTRDSNPARSIISRKFEENPFIPDDFWELVAGSYLIGSKPYDSATISYLSDRGINIGLTTAVVVTAAAELAQKGKTVIVPIYERFRDYSPR